MFIRQKLENWPYGLGLGIKLLFWFSGLVGVEWLRVNFFFNLVGVNPLISSLKKCMQRAELDVRKFLWGTVLLS